MKTRRHTGFTIIELMITVAVAATLTTMGVPAMSEFSKNSAVKATTYSLFDDISIARSEAIKRGTRVILCRTADPAATSPTCSGSSYTWTSGWIVYAAGDSNETYNAGVDVLISRNDGASGTVAIKSNGTSNSYLAFNPDGSLDESGAGRYAICDERGESHGKQVTIPLMGRAGIEKGTVSNPISSCSSPS